MKASTSLYLLPVLFVWIFLVQLLIGCQTSHPGPPKDFQLNLLDGVWEARYSAEEVDQLVIRSDGTYKQVFRRGQRLIESEWHYWELEHLDSGNTRIILHQGRFNASQAPLPLNLEFYDPFEEEFVRMRWRLVLQVRTDSSGNLILHHLFTDPDNGFLVFGSQRRYFQKVE